MWLAPYQTALWHSGANHSVLFGFAVVPALLALYYVLENTLGNFGVTSICAPWIFLASHSIACGIGIALLFSKNRAPSLPLPLLIDMPIYIKRGATKLATQCS